MKDLVRYHLYSSRRFCNYYYRLIPLWTFEIKTNIFGVAGGSPVYIPSIHKIKTRDTNYSIGYLKSAANLSLSTVPPDYTTPHPVTPQS
jgi:hypothetical protein